MSETKQDGGNDRLRGLVDIAKAQEILGGVSRPTIYELFRDGSLRRVKVRGRTMIRVGDLDRYIEAA
jgi:excisionase family DNA binding protein